MEENINKKNNIQANALNVGTEKAYSKYYSYQNDSTLRWQELDTARAFKIDLSDVDLIVSPFASLFEALIDLVDLQALMNVKDSLDIYKLLVMKIPLLNSKSPDDLALSLSLAKKFYNVALETLPPEIGLILSPGMDIDSVSFDKNATTDTNAISDAYQNIMEETGISQIFDSSRLTGSTSVKMSMLSDALMATKGILPQVTAFVNERIQMEYPNSVAYIKFIEVTTYTKEDRINKSILIEMLIAIPVSLIYCFYSNEILSILFPENFRSYLICNKS